MELEPIKLSLNEQEYFGKGKQCLEGAQKRGQPYHLFIDMIKNSDLECKGLMSKQTYVSTRSNRKLGNSPKVSLQYQYQKYCLVTK